MPRIKIEHHELFNEHLWELNELLSDFAEKNGYTYHEPMSAGLYPKVMLTRESNISQAIIIDMDLNHIGKKFEFFFPEIPYSLSANCWIDEEKEGRRIRYSGPYAAVGGIPFSALKTSINLHLKYLHAHLENMSDEIIYACGIRHYP
ncbi:MULTISPECIES: hypothetical protein [unclassified Lentimonas]|uniref:hypothetical protein n=1 Tax=unclassified Lentimonas TaxID=2630993 RepID=UPI00132A574F|nr:MULTISPECIES: hypothetical protein [unclassified Lentimonas]CAA6694906.1 Unannotated [Lentimonas sp. CC19]CAA6695225.1 Unannotated [Lentimonas sp. CC10]CAA7071953.1 Unannotated [Lentimonas sp. CC11]